MRHYEIMGQPHVYMWGFIPSHGNTWEHYMHVIWWKERNKGFGEFFEYCLN